MDECMICKKQMTPRAQHTIRKCKVICLPVQVTIAEEEGSAVLIVALTAVGAEAAPAVNYMKTQVQKKEKKKVHKHSRKCNSHSTRKKINKKNSHNTSFLD